jgi:hypothetical protein
MTETLPTILQQAPWRKLPNAYTCWDNTGNVLIIIGQEGQNQKDRLNDYPTLEKLSWPLSEHNKVRQIIQ